MRGKEFFTLFAGCIAFMKFVDHFEDTIERIPLVETKQNILILSYSWSKEISSLLFPREWFSSYSFY